MSFVGEERFRGMFWLEQPNRSDQMGETAKQSAVRITVEFLAFTRTPRGFKAGDRPAGGCRIGSTLSSAGERTSSANYVEVRCSIRRLARPPVFVGVARNFFLSPLCGG